MIKYRIKFKDGRVVGPFLKDQIGELFQKGHLNGDEDCQEFPNGDWKKLSEFPALSDEILKFIKGKKGSKEKESTGLKEFNKFKQDQIVKKQEEQEFEIDELEEEEPPKTEFQELKRDNIPVDKTVKINLDKLEKPAAAEKTVVKKFSQEELDEINQLKQEKIAKANPAPIEPPPIEEVKEVPESEPEEPKNQATQMINLGEIKEQLSNEVEEGEKEIEVKSTEKETKEKLKKKIEEEKELKAKKEAEESNNEDDDDIEAEEEKKKKKKIILIGVIASLLIYLFYESVYKPRMERNKPIQPVYAEITFPISEDIVDPQKAEEFYNQATSLLESGRYIDKLKAAQLLKVSVEKNDKDNPAQSLLLQTYSELLNDTKDDIRAGNIVYKLMQINEMKILSDVNVATASGIFYDHFKKYKSAVRVTENFIRVGKSNLKLFSVYLISLVNIGKMDDAKKAYDKINGAAKKPIEAYLALYKYHYVQDDFAMAGKVILDGIKQHPTSVKLLLQYAELLVQQSDYKKLAEILPQIKELRAENSVSYYAKYLEYAALLLVINKKIPEATKYFRESLKYKESSELRSKIASLDINSDKGGQDLALESKTLDLMKQAESELKKKNVEKAFSLAVEATDLFPTYVPARILFAKIQAKQGYFNEAIETLQKFQKEKINDLEITFELADMLIEGFKYNDAKTELSNISNLPNLNQAKYMSIMGKMYHRAGNFEFAVQWLQRAINENPINDTNYFFLAEAFLKKRKYNEAKIMLNKAMGLDPDNVEYRSLYGKILYELDDVETAIGYIREALNEFPDNPKLLSDIAIYYHRSGQIKNFQEFKEKLQQTTGGTTEFYRFMIKAAELEDNLKDKIFYSQELLKINPADLEVRVDLGRSLMENNDANGALDQFLEVKERMRSFPRLLYYISKIYLLQGNIEKSIDFAKQETTLNPGLEDGFVLLGDIYLKQEDFNAANENYKKAQAINQKSVDALMGLAWIQYKRNLIESALEMYTKAQDLAPNNAIVKRQLGYVYKLMGQGQLAIQSFKSYLEMNPNATDKADIEAAIKLLQ
ncbi:MAG: tetratricopeptide repeat protein [Bacteriovoracaceae bacterium]